MANMASANLFASSKWTDRGGKPQKDWWKDESYSRWKGGAKLASELTAFYTSKAAANRIAAQNSFGPEAPAAKKAERYRERLVMRLHGSMQQRDRLRQNWETNQRLAALESTAASASAVPKGHQSLGGR